MSYDYQKERPALFTDDGQRMLLAIRDNVRSLLKQAGAVRMDKAIEGSGGGAVWKMMACVDRMVELGELHECRHPNYPAGQNRIFTDVGWRA